MIPSWRMLVTAVSMTVAVVASLRSYDVGMVRIAAGVATGLCTMWLWHSDMRAIESRSYTAGWYDGHKKALHDSVYALRKTFGGGQ